METKFQTSFIPRKPIAQETARKAGISLFLLISVIVFLIVLGISGYVFLEKQLLVKNIINEQQVIEQNQTGLVSDATTIESIITLDSRINVANQLLNSHVSISPIFGFLQQITLRNVRFRNFSFTVSGKDEAGQPRVAIQMSGQARDFETVASQADEFGKTNWNNIIKEPKISGLNLATDGSVTFTFSAFVVPVFINYVNQKTNTSL